MGLRYDAIVLGGGLVGMAAAAALAGPAARPPATVVLVDSRNPRAFAIPSHDGRASAITATSVNVLKNLGLWAELEPVSQAMWRIEVMDGRIDQSIRPVLLAFDDVTQDGEPFATMIENHEIYRALYARMTDTASAVSVEVGSRVSAIDFGPAGVRLTLEDGRRLESSLLIAADGRDSFARRAAGIETVGWSYAQTGLVTTVEHEKPHHGVAVECFLPAGPFAILPLVGNRSSLVWTETEEDANHLMALDRTGFTRELKRRFGDRLGAVESDGPRHAFPLSMHIARDYCAHRLVLVGDAAHVLHPLAGLGFNLGLRDIAALAECVGDALSLGLDPGSPEPLRRYQAWRRFDTVKVAAMTDGLNRLFSNDYTALRSVRGFGLSVVDRLPPLKRFFMRQAAGFDADRPRLMRGDGAGRTVPR